MYRTWLRAVGRDGGLAGRPGAREFQDFAFRLMMETKALAERLLRHPRFRWTSIDREKLAAEGKSPAQIDALLMPRIVQFCENEVLGIIHRSFFASGWRVRALVFDGLIAEGPSGTPLPHAAIDAAQIACREHGWDVRLIEKPLFGQQDAPMRTLERARNALALVDFEAQSCARAR